MASRSTTLLYSLHFTFLLFQSSTFSLPYSSSYDGDEGVVEIFQPLELSYAESGQGGVRAERQLINQNNAAYYGAVQQGVGCGYLRMRPGQVVSVQSSNFQIGEYYNNEACVWRFFGHHCSLSAQCPCADIPQSHSCIEDYLKISDTFLFNQRFCGDIRPEGTYESATNNLKIRFRTDHKETAAGFLCYVSCRAPGAPYYVLPSNITCPTSGFYTGITTGIPTTGTPNANYTGEVIIPPVTPPPGGR